MEAHQNMLTTTDPTGYAVTTMEPGTLQEIVTNNVGTTGLHPSDLDCIVVPPGGGTVFTVPTPEGDQTTPTIQGIVILIQTNRAYWSAPLDLSDGSSPPDCASEDGLHGIGNPGGDCAICALSQFGSRDDGRGQACRQQQRLFFLRPSDILPIIVNVPPTSLQAIRRYLVRLASQGIPFWSVITRFGLERTRSRGNIVYSRLVPSLVTRLTPDEAARMQAYGESLRQVL